MKINIKTKLPGAKSIRLLSRLKKLNGSNSVPYPFIHSNEGKGCYFKDIEGNTFLDFAAQISSNPLGYNNSSLVNVVNRYKNRHPVKYAGQDFPVKEHLELLEELLKITPKGLDAAFLVNSGAEAVENAMKISIRDKKHVELGVCFRGSFHGRTLGALSFVTSKQIYIKGYELKIPSRVLSFNENAKDELIKMLNEEGAGKIGFVIMEAVQGEGGYNVADPKMVKDIRKITKQYNIPFICDEVQCGMGRTGEWWAINNYNVKPDVMSAAKALQVGATIANKKRFPDEEGAISSTWGGGHIIDMALGIETIRTIKRDKLLLRNKRNGEYMRKRLKEIEEDVPVISDVRGLGLMSAFDLTTTRLRYDVVIECFKKGLILLGCGGKGIRLIPPYVVSKDEIDEAFEVIIKSIDVCSVKGFKHKENICKFMNC